MIQFRITMSSNNSYRSFVMLVDQVLTNKTFNEVKWLMKAFHLEVEDKGCPQLDITTSIKGQGAYCPDFHMVGINPANVTLTKAKILEVLAHEVCHSLQNKEANEVVSSSTPYALRPYEHEAFAVGRMYSYFKCECNAGRKRFYPILITLLMKVGVIRRSIIRNYGEMFKEAMMKKESS